MKYNFFLPILILIFSQSVDAQSSDKSRFNFGLSAGIAIPVGDFGKAGEFYETGYSNLGLDIAVSGNIRLKNHFGLTMHVSRSNFSFNKNIDSTHLYFPTDNSHTIISANNIKQTLLMAGLSYTLRKGKFEFTFSVLSGCSFVSYPEIKIEEYWLRLPNTIPSLNDPFEEEFFFQHQDGYNSNAIAYGLEFVVSRQITEHWSLFLSSKFTNAFHGHRKKEEKVLPYGVDPDASLTVNTWFGIGVIGYYQYVPTILAYQSLKFNLGVCYNF